MSDVAPDITPDAPVEAAPEAAPEAAEPTAELTFEELESSYDALEADPNTPEASKGELRKLRAEHKRYRETFGGYKDAFDGVADGDRDAIFGLSRLLATGDSAGAGQWLVAAAKSVLGDEQFAELIGSAAGTGAPAAEPASPEATEAAVDFSDPAQVAEFVAQQVEAKLAEAESAKAAQASEKATHELIANTFEELGVPPTSGQGKAILFDARALMDSKPNLSVEAAIREAHDAFKAQFDEEVQKYAATKAADAGQSVPTNGQATAGSTLPPDDSLTLEQQIARNARARLDRAYSGQPLSL